MKMKAETGWCSRDRGHQCLWVTAVFGENWTVCGLVTQPEEANEDGNSVLPAALCQTLRLQSPLSTHIQHTCKVGPLLTFSSKGCCPAPQPGTSQHLLPSLLNCSSSLFFRCHLNHRLELCQVASLQFSNATHPAEWSKSF